MRIFHRDCLPDGRMPSRLPERDYSELTAPPMEIPDNARPVHIIFTELVGGHAKNENGVQRYEDYWQLKSGAYLRLFIHRSNRYDKNAVAVFYAEDVLFESNELGHIPKIDNKEVIAKFNEGLLLEARVSRVHEWYKLKDVDEEHPQYDVSVRVNCYPGLDAPFDLILYSKGYLSTDIISEFSKKGLGSPASISAATDQELLSISGVGPKRLAHLRTLFPNC